MPSRATGTARSLALREVLERGDKGAAVRALQQLLSSRGYAVEIDGDFGGRTFAAVKAFQSQNLDPLGHPLVVDGSVGPLTWWSLTHPKPLVTPAPGPVDFRHLPGPELGGSKVARAALQAAIGELSKGAGEVGGNNAGPFVRKYLKPAGLPEGNSWCASFVSWCFMTAAGAQEAMPFPYCPGARALLTEFRNQGWAHPPNSNYVPQPGDLVFWWRVKLQGWQGHVGLVHRCKDGILYTIEGNRSPKVQGFSYVFSRMDQLLGFGEVPDE